MSSICGIISKEKFSNETLENMSLSMKHRGNYNEKLSLLHKNDTNIGLAINVFNIGGKTDNQPYTYKNKVLISDGYIYNIEDIKRELSISDNVTQSKIILTAYEKWGYKCVEHFNGDFAIVIYDITKNELYCTRARFGIKPLNYYITDNCFVFASELKAIMLYPEFKNEINTSCLAQYLTQRYVHFPETIFMKTYKLEMGTFLVYKNGNIEKKQYYNISDEYFDGQKNLIKDYEYAKTQLEILLCNAVKIRTEDSVNIGALLSGGIDSSLMVALTQKQQSNPIKTFTIGFDDKNFDEAIYSKEISKILGSQHTELYIGEKDMLSIIDKIPIYYDEPYADSSQIPAMYAYLLAKENGVDLTITGDGGDEQFCGYPHYKIIQTAKKLDLIGNCLYKAFSPLNIIDNLPRKVKNIVNNRNVRTKTQLITENEYMRKYLFKDKQHGTKFEIEDRFPIDNWMMRAMLVDMQAGLPGGIIKLERASMIGSVSSRSPLFDYRVNQFSFMLPFDFLYKTGVTKKILRDILYKYIPKAIMERPKKGFSIPEGKWLRNSLKERLIDYSNKDFLIKQDIFNADILIADMKKFINGESGKLGGPPFYWSFLVFQIWYDKYILKM